MSSKILSLILAGVAALCAQDTPLDPHSSVKINLPADSPVSLISANMGESRASARGGAMLLDLHMELTLRNSGPRNIRGVTLLVLAQEVTPGGRASATQTSLDVSPGAVFPMHISVRLLRPLQVAGGPLVEVSLDGVLFDNLYFYGPNRLESRRSLTAWELEAQRDRQHLKSVLAAYGPEGLKRSMLDSLNRQAERPRLDVIVSRGGRSTTSAAGAERTAQFAFLKFPDAPVEALAGSAQIAGSEARAPRVQIRNRSAKPVRYVELGWIVRDRQGREFMAASLPASNPELLLAPGQSDHLLQDSTLKFSRNGAEAIAVDGMTGFISQVEYADGKVWVPNRTSLESAQLLRVLAPSPEEQRLTDLYRKKGLSALMEELKKF